MSDQAALPNLNANWVNSKGRNRIALLVWTGTHCADDIIGAWTIHFVLIAALKIFYDIIPGVSQETSWTLTNITYMFVTFIMFHYVTGIPFEFNAGAYDNLNMWEQIDNGDQYTPAKKFLLSVPIILFLLSTHYTHYDSTYFLINFLATLGVVIPKLPIVSLSVPGIDLLLTSVVVTPDAHRPLFQHPRRPERGYMIFLLPDTSFLFLSSFSFCLD